MRLLLITGWGFTKEIWQPVEQRLAGKWNVKCLDFLEDFPGEDNNLSYCSQLKDKIKYFKPDIVAGWSMGAIVLLETLVKFEMDDFLTVLLAGTACFIQENDTGPEGVQPVRLRAMKRGLSRDPVFTLEQFYRLAARPEKTKPKEGMIANPGYFENQLLEGLEYLGGVDLTDRLDKIDRRIKLIHGRNDAVIPIGAGRYLADNLAEGELVEIENGHLIPVQNPEKLVEILQKYLEESR